MRKLISERGKPLVYISNFHSNLHEMIMTSKPLMQIHQINPWSSCSNLQKLLQDYVNVPEQMEFQAYICNKTYTTVKKKGL